LSGRRHAVFAWRVEAHPALASLLPTEVIEDRVDEALVRFCALLRQAPDGAAAVPGLTWTVGELGAHLVTGAKLWSRMLGGERSPISSLSEASAHTARMIAEFDERDPERLADVLEQETRPPRHCSPLTARITHSPGTPDSS